MFKQNISTKTRLKRVTFQTFVFVRPQTEISIDNSASMQSSQIKGRNHKSISFVSHDHPIQHFCFHEREMHTILGFESFNMATSAKQTSNHVASATHIATNVKK